MPKVPDVAFVTLAPDWVCEVLSPSTRKFDLDGKRPIYAREDMGHLWFVDPAARTLEAFALHEGIWTPAGSAQEAEAVSLPPFDAITSPPQGPLALNRRPASAANYHGAKREPSVTANPSILPPLTFSNISCGAFLCSKIFCVTSISS